MKQSAGILVYRRQGKKVQVLLAHAGGPFWAKKDKGAWTIPKGEFTGDETPENAARREFAEEIGQPAPSGTLHDLGTIKRKDGKVIYAFAVEGDMDVAQTHSNTFEMEWPPKSGQMQSFPEIDRAAWTDMSQAPDKMHSGQSVFIERLIEQLGVKLPKAPEQASLF